MAVRVEILTDHQRQLLSEASPLMAALKDVSISGYLAGGKSAVEIKNYLNNKDSISVGLRQVKTYLTKFVKANLICCLTNRETDRLSYYNRLDVPQSFFL